MGARRIGVLGAPPLGRVSFKRKLFGGIERKCSQEINSASKLFNTKLSAELNYLNQNLPQAKVVYIDVYNPLLHIIENPTKYGFEVVDKGCCGTGTLEVAVLCNRLELTCTDDSKYVFWHNYHPPRGHTRFWLVKSSTDMYPVSFERTPIEFKFIVLN